MKNLSGFTLLEITLALGISTLLAILIIKTIPKFSHSSVNILSQEKEKIFINNLFQALDNEFDNMMLDDFSYNQQLHQKLKICTKNSEKISYSLSENTLKRFPFLKNIVSPNQIDKFLLRFSFKLNDKQIYTTINDIVSLKNRTWLINDTPIPSPPRYVDIFIKSKNHSYFHRINFKFQSMPL